MGERKKEKEKKVKVEDALEGNNGHVQNLLDKMSGRGTIHYLLSLSLHHHVLPWVGAFHASLHHANIFKLIIQIPNKIPQK